MAEQHDAPADASEQCEFQRLVEGHVRDIRALALFYARQGWDLDILEGTLKDAAQELIEVAHSIPSRRSRSATGENARPIRIVRPGDRRRPGRD